MRYPPNFCKQIPHPPGRNFEGLLPLRVFLYGWPLPKKESEWCQVDQRGPAEPSAPLQTSSRERIKQPDEREVTQIKCISSGQKVLFLCFNGAYVTQILPL